MSISTGIYSQTQVATEEVVIAISEENVAKNGPKLIPESGTTEGCCCTYSAIKKLTYKKTSATARNILRIGITGGLAAAGVVVAGLVSNLSDKGIAILSAAAFLTCVANGTSTFFSWEDLKESQTEEMSQILAEQKIEIHQLRSEIIELAKKVDAFSCKKKKTHKK